MWPVRAAILVMAGGAAGAASRWTVHELVPVADGGFPWSTFAVNVVGCLLVGLAARHVARNSDLWAGLVVGVLGGLTTFSTFAVETRVLIADGHPRTAIAYVAATMIVGIAATELARSGRRSA